MSPDDILDLYYKSMAEISLQRSDVHDSIEHKLTSIGSRISFLGGDPGDTVWSQNMYFRDPISGEGKFYGRVRLTLTQTREINLRHANRKYQWLLAEAYEEFEIFLKRIFAILGATTRSFWTAEHYGQNTFTDLNKLDFEACYKLTQSKIKNVNDILNLIRKRINGFSDLEESNMVMCNLKLHTALVANLRHQIVHTRGIVHNKSDFQKKILESLGYWSNGKPKQEHLNLIEGYFLFRDDPNRICLVRAQTNVEDLYVDLLDSACRNLVQHAYIIACKISEYINTEGSAPSAGSIGRG